MLLDTFHDVFGQDTFHRPDNSVAVCLSCLLGIDFQCSETGDFLDLGDLVADFCTENLAHIGRWISADQQDALVLAGQLDGSSAGDRCFADAAFASEEEEAGWGLKKLHGILLSAATTGRAASAALRVRRG